MNIYSWIRPVEWVGTLENVLFCCLDSEPYGCFDDINPHTVELSTMGSARLISLCLKNWITWESSLCLRYEGESIKI